MAGGEPAEGGAGKQHGGKAGAEAALSARFNLRIVADDTFNRDPAPGAKENDVQLTSQLVYKY